MIKRIIRKIVGREPIVITTYNQYQADLYTQRKGVEDIEELSDEDYEELREFLKPVNEASDPRNW